MRFIFVPMLALVIQPVFAQQRNPIVERQWSYEYLDSVCQSHKGEAYPPFHLRTLEGKTIDNNTCLGKPTFISFWFESCNGCVTEFPQINRLYDSINKDPRLQFIAMTFDHRESLPQFLKDHYVHFPVATTEDQDVFKNLSYGMGCPSYIVLNAKGRIAEIGMYGIDQTSGYRTISISGMLHIMRALL
jgi:cytochrome oxidase Cu insertion factor (SCO1/SenC/PrrC family)